LTEKAEQSYYRNDGNCTARFQTRLEADKHEHRGKSSEDESVADQNRLLKLGPKGEHLLTVVLDLVPHATSGTTGGRHLEPRASAGSDGAAGRAGELPRTEASAAQTSTHGAERSALIALLLDSMNYQTASRRTGRQPKEQT